MRIVYVCADRGIPLLGDKGASVHLRSLSAALAKRGNEVCLACHNLTGQNPTPVGVKVALLPDNTTTLAGCWLMATPSPMRQCN